MIVYTIVYHQGSVSVKKMYTTKFIIVYLYIYTTLARMYNTYIYMVYILNNKNGILCNTPNRGRKVYYNIKTYTICEMVYKLNYGIHKMPIDTIPSHVIQCS